MKDSPAFTPLFERPVRLGSPARLGSILLAFLGAYFIVDFALIPSNRLVQFPVYHDDYTNFCTGFPTLHPPSVRPVSTLVIACLGRLGSTGYDLTQCVLALLYAALVILLLERLFRLRVPWIVAFLSGLVLFSLPESIEWFKYTGLMTNLTSASLGIASLHVLLSGLEGRRPAPTLLLAVILVGLSAFSKEDFILPGLILSAAFLLGPSRSKSRVAALIAALVLITGAALYYENRMAGSPFSGNIASGVYAVSLAPGSVMRTLLRYMHATSYLSAISALFFGAGIVGFMAFPQWRKQLVLITLMTVSLIGPYCLLPNHFYPYYAYGWVVWEVSTAGIVLSAFFAVCHPFPRTALRIIAAAAAAGAVALTYAGRQSRISWYRTTGDTNRRMVQTLLDHRTEIERERAVGVLGLDGNSPWAVSKGDYLSLVLGFWNDWIVFVPRSDILYEINGGYSRLRSSLVHVRNVSEAASRTDLLFVTFDRNGKGTLTRGVTGVQVPRARLPGSGGGPGEPKVRSTR